jgi:hypothetical protein
MNTRLAGLLIAVPLFACAASLAPTSPQVPAALRSCDPAASPSRLDYVVLASLADSSNWLAMSAYSPAPMQDSPQSTQR